MTRFAILFILRQIFENDNKGLELLNNPEKFVMLSQDRTDFIKSVTTLIKDIIIDFNGEVQNLREDFGL